MKGNPREGKPESSGKANFLKAWAWYQLPRTHKHTRGAGACTHAHTDTQAHAQVSTHSYLLARLLGDPTKCRDGDPRAKILSGSPVSPERESGLTARTLWASSPTVTAPSSSHLGGRGRAP